MLALPLLVACTHPVTGSVTVTTGEDPVTVATASITAESAISAYVEYGETDAYGMKTPTFGPAANQDIVLLGLRGGTPYHYRVVEVGADGDVPWDDATFHTLPYPDGMPDLNVEGSADPADGWTVMSLLLDTPELHAFVYILDPDGVPVWYKEVDGIVMTARLTADRSAMVVQVTRDDPDTSVLTVYPIAGGDGVELPCPGAHHDWLELPDGNFVSIVEDRRIVDGVDIVGDALRVIDPNSTESEVIWDTFAHVPIVENEGWEQYPHDWTHANGLSYDVASDTFALSLFRQEEVWFFDSSGETITTMGGTGTVTFVDDAGFGPQHAPRFTEEGGLMLFDNSTTGVSRVVEYTLDLEAGTATRRFEEHNPDGHHTVVLGDGEHLPSGGLLTAWGDLGQVINLDANGDVRRRIAHEGHGIVGRITALDSLYPPAP